MRNSDLYGRVTLPESEWAHITRWFGSNVSLTSIVLTELNRIKKTKQNGPRETHPLGIAAIDALVDGVSPGEILYIGSEEEQYNTALGLHTVRNLAILGEKSLLVFHCAMGEYAYARKLLSLCTGIEERTLQAVQALSEEELARLDAVAGVIQHSDVSIVSTPNICVEDICSEVEGLSEALLPDLILIDSLSFLTARKKCKSKQDEYCVIAQRLWNLAKDTGIPIVLTGPLSKHRRKNDRPTALDMPAEELLDSFDKIVMVHRCGKKSDILNATAIKNPHGTYGCRRLSLDLLA